MFTSFKSLSSMLHDEAKQMKLCNSNQTPSPSLPVKIVTLKQRDEKRNTGEERKKKPTTHTAFQETFKCRGNSKERYQERKYNYHYTVRTILVIVFFPCQRWDTPYGMSTEVFFGWKSYGQVTLYLGNKTSLRYETIHVITCNTSFPYVEGRY